jgi:hypothetical protein
LTFTDSRRTLPGAPGLRIYIRHKQRAQLCPLALRTLFITLYERNNLSVQGPLNLHFQQLVPSYVPTLVSDDSVVCLISRCLVIAVSLAVLFCPTSCHLAPSFCLLVPIGLSICYHSFVLFAEESSSLFQHTSGTKPLILLLPDIYWIVHMVSPF